nr:hypothetical protein [uncultured Devosia sp.]
MRLAAIVSLTILALLAASTAQSNPVQTNTPLIVHLAQETAFG